MRLWMVDPVLLCRKHLLGEARETHALAGIIIHGMPLSGTKYISNGLVEVHNIRNRHDALAKEMVRRGYNHKSPLPEFNSWVEGHVNVSDNLKELSRRCPECRKLQHLHGIFF
jgi:hypothetical protein